MEIDVSFIKLKLTDTYKKNYRENNTEKIPFKNIVYFCMT